MRRWLAGIVDVRPGEVRRVGGMFALHGLIIATAYILKPVRSSLFLSEFGSAPLGRMENAVYIVEVATLRPRRGCCRRLRLRIPWLVPRASEVGTVHFPSLLARRCAYDYFFEMPLEALRANFSMTFGLEAGRSSGGCGSRTCTRPFRHTRAVVSSRPPRYWGKTTEHPRGRWAPYRCFNEAATTICHELETATRGSVRFPRCQGQHRSRRDAGEISPHGLRVAKGLLQAKMNRPDASSATLSGCSSTVRTSRPPTSRRTRIAVACGGGNRTRTGPVDPQASSRAAATKGSA